MLKQLFCALFALHGQLTNSAVTKRSPNVVSLDVSLEPVNFEDDSISTQYVLSKRNTVSLSVAPNNDYFVYLASVSFGTPPQTVYLVADAVGGDTFVNVPTNAWCQNATNGCSQWGTYDRTKSSTYTFLRNGFNITYSDYTTAYGEYVTDTVSFGGISLPNQEFGLALTSNSSIAVLGLGYPVQEQQVIVDHKQPYPSVVQAMANAGIINTNAYSIWLTDPSSSKNGTFLFGGVDSDKYTGQLRTVEIVESTSNQSSIIVPLTGLTFGKEEFINGTNNTLSVYIDTGTSWTTLPSNITDHLFPVLGVMKNDTGAYIPCAQINNQTTLNFTLSWPQVNITIGELVVPNLAGDNEKMCLFGIQTDENEWVLGQTFIRGAYLVFNLGFNEISIARTKFNATSSNILEITSGLDGVPGAVRAPAQTSAPPAHSSLSGGAKAGIGVGVTLGLILAGISGGFLFMRRQLQKRRMSEATAAASESLMSPRSGVTAVDDSVDEYRKIELSGDSIYKPVELETDDADTKELPGRKFSAAPIELPDRKYSAVAFELPDRKYSAVEAGGEGTYLIELPGDGPENVPYTDRKDPIEDSPSEETLLEERRDMERERNSNDDIRYINR